MDKKQKHNLKRANHRKHLRKVAFERKVSYKKDPEAFMERMRLKQEALHPIQEEGLEKNISLKTVEKELLSKQEGTEIPTIEKQDSI